MGHFDINKICEDAFFELFKLEVDSGAKPGVTTDQSKRMKELKREVRKPQGLTRCCARLPLFSRFPRDFRGQFTYFNVCLWPKED